MLKPVTLLAEAAECVTSSDSTPGPAALPSCEELFPAWQYDSQVSPWRIGFAAGYGQRSNPLINSDDIPIYGLIQLSYFGEHFFFDNGDLGWFITEGKNWNLNAIAGIGGERSFYSFLNDSSIGFIPSSFEPGGIEDQAPSEGEDDTGGDLPGFEEVKIEAPDRDYAVDGGLEFSYQLPGSEIQLQLVTDISDKHNGQEAWLSWVIPRRFGRWEFTPSVGVTWKSADAANYYYGVKESEAQPGLPAYEVDASVNVFARMTLRYNLNEHWKLISVWQYERLDEEIRDSPSVEDDQVQTGFMGIYYEF